MYLIQPTMKIPFFSWLYLITICSLFVNFGVFVVSDQCLHDQRDLLIGLKNNHKFNSTLSTKLVLWNESQNCCLWKGVTCSEEGRVIGLNLFNESMSGRLHNSSLCSLQYLENLNLAYNKLSSSLVPSQFGNLTNLIYLNLSNAGFEGQIPIEISNLSRLVTLDLSTNSYLSDSMLKIEKPNLATLVQNFGELKELYLDGVNISAPGNEWCQALSSSAPNLRGLWIRLFQSFSPLNYSSGNPLNAPVPEFFANFLSLTSLNLKISFKFLHCRRLNYQITNYFKGHVLILRSNKFYGSIDCGGLNTTWPILKIVDLASNKFTGRLPRESLSAWKAMMDDAQSQFEHLQYGKIEVMGCYYQDVITVTNKGLDMELNLIRTSNMYKYLYSRSTSDCNNHIEDAFFLCYLRKISSAILDDEDEVQPVLNHIHIVYLIQSTMKIPFFSWLYLITICSLFANFGIFVVSDQCLHDQRDLLIGLKNSLKFSSTLSTKLVHWNESQNCCLWKGVSCSEEGRVIGLNLFNESISGRLHNSSLFSLQYLENLNLAYNKLSSSLIPSQFGNLTNLIYLNLSNAGFEGQIPIEISNLSRLVTLDLSTYSYLSDSMLKIEKPNLAMLVQNFGELKELNLDGVNISAPGNEWCQALSSSVPNQRVLSMSDCYLSGPFNSSLSKFQGLFYLNLSYNLLEGPLPNLPSTLTILDLHSNQLQGQLPTLLPSATYLDLSRNNFSSVIPAGIGSSLTFAYFLSLSNNKLSGSNLLSGTIPQCFYEMSETLVVLNRWSRWYFTHVDDILIRIFPQLNLGIKYRYMSLSKLSCDLTNFTDLLIKCQRPMLQIVDLTSNKFTVQFQIESFSTKAILDDEDEVQPVLNHIHPPMKIPYFSWLFLIPICSLFVSFGIFVVSGQCLGDQQSYLLELKNTLKFNSTLSTKLVRWNGSVDCCLWEGVTCSEEGRVIGLNLFNESMKAGLDNSMQGYEWCQALSSSLPNLSVLSMSDCYLSGPFDSSILKLQSLSVIRLYNNPFNAPVPEFFANFTNLTSLVLSSCGLIGTFPKKIFQIQTLQKLDLSYNDLLQGALPDFIGDLKMLSIIDLSWINTELYGRSYSIGLLDMSSNNFTGPIPSFSMAKNLTQIYLFRKIDSLNWKDLLNLVNLELSYNSLEGNIPVSFFSLPSLQTLQLSNNQFSGQLNEVSNASSCQLEILDLSSNYLEGSIPMSIFKIRGLRKLFLSSNNFNSSLQLNVIQQLRNLFNLDLSNDRLSIEYNGTSSPLFSFPQVSTLKLASCKLKVFPDFLINQSILTILDLSNNQIHGEIPNWIWKFSNILVLDLSFNHLVMTREGPLLNLSSFSVLSVLDLHSNQFEGELPVLPPNATYLDFSMNNFNSAIPASIGDYLSVAYFFSISSNKFHGSIPQSLCNATYLQVLNLSNNTLNGTIPQCLIQMSKNLGVLDVRRNKPNAITVTSKGQDLDLVKILNIFTSIDISCNKLEGPIPEEIGELKSLYVLNLSHNAFTNSSNRLTWAIPMQLADGLTFLSVLNLSFNQLVGQIPQIKQFATFLETSYEGNKGL
ncbi:receptor-like protein 33 [Quercus suber]|uniref:Receptor-like protein 33 n=1 Tax=Quercus suber TaxID=58331 RepID=A0AAW0L0L2_QUESU